MGGAGNRAPDTYRSRLAGDGRGQVGGWVPKGEQNHRVQECGASLARDGISPKRFPKVRAIICVEQVERNRSILVAGHMSSGPRVAHDGCGLAQDVCYCGTIAIDSTRHIESTSTDDSAQDCNRCCTE